MYSEAENDKQEYLSQNIDQGTQTEHLLCKLRQVFRDGYRPARGTQPYNVRLANQVKAYTMVNCLGHVFNLRNEQFNDYGFGPYAMYGYFPGMRLDSNEHAADRMFDFIKEIGLKVEACDPRKAIDDFKSWKIALYFQDNPHYRDFHYLLEDRPQFWSSKIGFEPCVEHVYETMPPEFYRNLVDNNSMVYKLFGTYKITNPNADENNRYLKHLVLPCNSAPKSFSMHHYVAEDARQTSFERVVEELLSR